MLTLVQQNTPGTTSVGIPTPPCNHQLTIMRRTVKQAAIVALVATFLFAIVLYANRSVLRVRYHRWAFRVNTQMMFADQKPPTTFVGTLSAILKPKWEACSQASGRHEEALLRLGYLSRQEFPFKSRTLNAIQLVTNAHSRFSSEMTTLCVLTNGQPSGSSVCTNSVVVVMAPKSEEQKWHALIQEFDQKTGQ